MTRTKTIVCGIDSSPGGRAAVRVAALLATQFDARLVAVHVLDRLTAVSQTAERAAAVILRDEVPDAVAVARGEVGDVAERLAAVARDEGAVMIVLGAGSRGRSRTFLRSRCATQLAELTNVPVVVVPFQVVAATATQGVLLHRAVCDEHVGASSEGMQPRHRGGDDVRAEAAGNSRRRKGSGLRNTNMSRSMKRQLEEAPR